MRSHKATILLIDSDVFGHARSRKKNELRLIRASCIRRSLCPSVRLSLCPPVRLSVWPSVCLSVCPLVRLAVSPSVRLSVWSVCAATVRKLADHDWLVGHVRLWGPWDSWNPRHMSLTEGIHHQTSIKIDFCLFLQASGCPLGKLFSANGFHELAFPGNNSTASNKMRQVFFCSVPANSHSFRQIFLAGKRVFYCPPDFLCFHRASLVCKRFCSSTRFLVFQRISPVTAGFSLSVKSLLFCSTGLHLSVFAFLKAVRE